MHLLLVHPLHTHFPPLPPFCLYYMLGFGCLQRHGFAFHYVSGRCGLPDAPRTISAHCTHRFTCGFPGSFIVSRSSVYSGF